MKSFFSTLGAVALAAAYWLPVSPETDKTAIKANVSQISQMLKPRQLSIRTGLIE